MKNSLLIKLIVSILICQCAGLIGSIFTRSSVDSWYALLEKPSFAPPNWVFGPVWIALYCLMGISLYLVWSQAMRRAVKVPLILFGIQLGFNAVWSFLFFGLQSTVIGFFGIMVLWLAIVITMVGFYRVSKTATVLLIPYIMWVSFAAVLNFYFVRLNV